MPICRLLLTVWSSSPPARLPFYLLFFISLVTDPSYNVVSLPVFENEIQSAFSQNVHFLWNVSTFSLWVQIIFVDFVRNGIKKELHKKNTKTNPQQQQHNNNQTSTNLYVSAVPSIAAIPPVTAVCRLYPAKSGGWWLSSLHIGFDQLSGHVLCRVLTRSGKKTSIIKPSIVETIRLKNQK